MKARTAPIAAAAVAVGVLAIAPAAAAHVTLNPREWEAGGFARFAVRVPNERDGASTTRVTLRFPEQVLSARFQPMEGWKRTVTMARLEKPIEVEGEQVAERIDTVTWSSGRIRPGEFQEFGISLRMPEEPGTELAFPAVQAYSGGEVVRWIGPPDADEPAPRVAVTQPDDDEAAAAPAATPSPGRTAAAAGEDSSSDTLSIVALVVAAAGLAAGLTALLRRAPETPGRGRVDATSP